MQPTLRDLLLSKTERRYAVCEIPEYGLKVGIRSLTEKERSAFEAESAKNDSLEDVKRRLIVLTAVDPESKQPLFTKLDAVQLEDVDSAVTGRLFDAAWKHMGGRPSDVEQLVKNSSTTAGNEQPTG